MRSITPARAAASSTAATGWLAVAAVVVALAGAQVLDLGAAGGRVWLLLVVAPIAEEALFRAGLQEALLRRWHAPLAANAATAVAFGLAHAALQASAAAFAVAIPALLVGAAYGRWRRLRICIALHAALNALWLGWSVIAPMTIPGN